MSIGFQGQMLLRVILAAGCGALIGIERELNAKTAGLRTHVIIAFASALTLVVSKYGFYDVVSDYVRLDPSRVAAGIAGSIGFLGTGIIFVQKKEVVGLTTASGLWATVAIGMAVGAGMYEIGIASTVFLVVMQYALHRRAMAKTDNGYESCKIAVCMEGMDLRELQQKLHERKIRVVGVQAHREKDDDAIYATLSVEYPDKFRFEDVVDITDNIPGITSIEVNYRSPM